MNKLRTTLERAIQSALTDEALAAARKKVADIAADLESSFQDGIQSNIAYNLTHWVERMAENAINAILNGDDESMRNYLSCREGGYNGRGREHQVIHGKLFEPGAIELRRRIVDAHADLLKNERILDLEDQVKSLVAQVNKAQAATEQLRQEFTF